MAPTARTTTRSRTPGVPPGASTATYASSRAPTSVVSPLSLPTPPASSLWAPLLLALAPLLLPHLGQNTNARCSRSSVFLTLLASYPSSSAISHARFKTCSRGEGHPPYCS